jgi:hypothetical protein
MTTKVYRVIVQIDQPRDGFPGRVAEGAYIVDDNTVILTDLQEFRSRTMKVGATAISWSQVRTLDERIPSRSTR